MTDGSNSKQQIRAFIERIENREREKKEASDDITAIYAEAKASGFDVPALRQLVRERKQDAQKMAEREAMVDLYRNALGDLASTPLGRAAVERQFS
jgi:uncharacterized protein (UPF0335 family)